MYQFFENNLYKSNVERSSDFLKGIQLSAGVHLKDAAVSLEFKFNEGLFQQ